MIYLLGGLCNVAFYVTELNLNLLLDYCVINTKLIDLKALTYTIFFAFNEIYL